MRPQARTTDPEPMRPPNAVSDANAPRRTPRFASPRSVALKLALALACGAGCGGGSGATGESGDGEVGGVDSGDPNDCAPPRDEQPTITLPATQSNAWTLDLEQFDIDNSGNDPVGTRTKFNEALQWAVEEGYDLIRVPPGTYLVGEKTNDIYSGGIDLPAGNLTLEFQAGAVLQMAPNDTWNYCVITVTGLDDVTIRGGEILGERGEHIFEPEGAHDEGHGICIQGASNRVLVEDIEIHEVTGDGILILGRTSEGTSSTNVTVRNSHLHHNRRQGVAIVGGQRIHIHDNEIDHIEGTSPQFGVDVESLDFVSFDILIENNDFHGNKGGDLVNTDGTNLWFVNNHLDQGDVVEQIDAPVIYWKKTDNTIRGNTIIMNHRTASGLWGILGYTSNDDPRTNPAANYFEDNHLIGAGIHFARSQDRLFVTGNRVDDGLILGSRVACLRLYENEITVESGESYKFREVSGIAADNMVNGVPAFLPMADGAPFTNSPPHLW